MRIRFPELAAVKDENVKIDVLSYVIEKLINKKVINGKVLYRVK